MIYVPTLIHSICESIVSIPHIEIYKISALFLNSFFLLTEKENYIFML